MPERAVYRAFPSATKVSGTRGRIVIREDEPVGRPAAVTVRFSETLRSEP